MRYDYDMLGNRIHSGQHGGRRALDAERRRGQPDPRLGQPRIMPFRTDTTTAPAGAVCS